MSKYFDEQQSYLRGLAKCVADLACGIRNHLNTTRNGKPASLATEYDRDESLRLIEIAAERLEEAKRVIAMCDGYADALNQSDK